MTASDGIFAGIDVFKLHLDLALWDDDRSWRFYNGPEGIDTLTQQLLALAPTLIAIEVTSGYEQAAARQLGHLGLLSASGQQERDCHRECNLLDMPVHHRIIPIVSGGWLPNGWELSYAVEFLHLIFALRAASASATG